VPTQKFLKLRALLDVILTELKEKAHANFNKLYTKPYLPEHVIPYQ